jgi:hypothetical protein
MQFGKIGMANGTLPRYVHLRHRFPNWRHLAQSGRTAFKQFPCQSLDAQPNQKKSVETDLA